MSLRNAGVHKALRKLHREPIQAGAGGHGSCDGDDLIAGRSEFAKALAKHLRKALAGALHHARLRVKGANPVIELGVLLRIMITFSLLGQHMNQDGTLHLFRPAKHALQLLYIVPIHRSHVVQANGTEHVIRENPGFDPLLHAVIQAVERRHVGEKLPIPALEIEIAGADAHSLQQPRHAAHIGIDGHVVVVEHDDHGLPAGRSGRQALVGQAAGQGAVPDHRHNVVVLMGEAPRLRHTQGDGHGVRGVTRDKSVILRFPGFGEAGKPPVLPEGGKTIPSSRQDLMNIALVTNVKNQPILLGVIHPVQRKRQLHCTKVGRQVAAGFGNMLHKEGPKLGAKRLQLLLREFFYVV